MPPKRKSSVKHSEGSANKKQKKTPPTTKKGAKQTKSPQKKTKVKTSKKMDVKASVTTAGKMPPKRKSSVKHSEGSANKKQKKTPPTTKKTTKQTKSPQKKTKVKTSKKMDVKASVTTAGGDSKISSKSSSLELSALVTDPKWKAALKDEFEKEYFKELENQLAKDYSSKLIFPPQDLIFHAFNATPIDKIKVVILGQDPYHDDGQAMGFSFSVPVGIKPPPSLKNIYKELTNDKDIIGFTSPDHGCLDKWTEEGVFLLNATLTVEAHKANSHAKYGWQNFTDEVIKIVNEKCSGVVFILWGNFAHKKEKMINESKHKIIKTAHPSPLSVSKFMGCKCFSDANKSLTKMGKTPINWSL